MKEIYWAKRWFGQKMETHSQCIFKTDAKLAGCNLRVQENYNFYTITQECVVQRC